MLVQLPKNWPADPPAPKPASESRADLLSIENLLAILRRRALLIGAAVAVMLAVGLVYLITTKPMFGSTALVYLDIENAQTLDGSRPNPTGVLGRPDDVDVNSQLQIIRSEKIAIRVIEQLGLEDAEEFTRPQNAIAQLASNGMRLIRSVIGSMVRLGPPPAPVVEEGVPRGLIDAFAKRLFVGRIDETFVIAIGFTSEDRQRAADVANAVANAYLEEKLDARYESVSRASTWLEGRLDELRVKAVASDQLVQDYKRDNGIIDTNTGSGGQLLSDTQLTELSARLGEARRETGERRARYNQIAQMLATGNPDAAVVDALDNPVINQLRQQYSKLAQQEADVSRRYGAEHEAAQRARQQMDDINGLILRELERIAQVYKSDLDVASKQEAELAESLEGFTDRSSDIAQALVRLRELERNAQADQNLYETFLDRYKTALQQQSFPITDARVLTEASPARGKSSPKTLITLALSGIAGVALGLLLALGRELADRTFRTPRQIERALGVPCLGVLPKLARGKARRPRNAGRSAAGRILAPNLGVFQHVVKAPLSRFAETLRSVKLAIDFAPNESGVRVIGVASSMPGEGKSTVAMNIAQLIASSGSSVLVIDADLRSPTLTREVTPNAEAGLFEFLVNNVPINELIYTDEAKRLKFLPAAGKGGAAQKADLIGSGKMAQLLTAARQTYNYVIIDLPPLAPVIDARAVAGSVDGFVFVVEWGATPIATVSDALHDAPLVNQKIIGCLLNKADESSLHLYTSSVGNSTYYQHEKFSSYVTQS